MCDRAYIKDNMINPYLTNEFSHCYQLGESSFIFRVLGVISNFYVIPLCKQNSPKWDAAFCGVTSGAMLFAYVPQKERQA